MSTFLLVAAIPVILPWILRLIWPREIAWLEMGVSILAALIITGAVYGAGMFAQTYDTEVWSGQVTSKEMDRVSCSHSYSCNCSTDSKGNQSCDTCYEHTWDYDWNVNTDIGTFTIDRVDRQGTHEPPRWTVVQKGDPVSDTHRFTNYVKAVPDSLFHKNAVAGFSSLVPTYPDRIYDYYRINRALSVGVVVPDLPQWNYEIAMLERKLGPLKQANVIVLFVNTPDRNYMEALEYKWLGGKKNDIVVVIGAPEYPKINWVGVLSWTDNQLFKVKLRDDVQALGVVDRVKILSAIDTDAIALFKRKEMKDFEYLSHQIEPPTWVLIIALILGIVTSLGTSLYFYRNDPFGKSYGRYRF